MLTLAPQACLITVWHQACWSEFTPHQLNRVPTKPRVCVKCCMLMLSWGMQATQQDMQTLSRSLQEMTAPEFLEVWLVLHLCRLGSLQVCSPAHSRSQGTCMIPAGLVSGGAPRALSGSVLRRRQTDASQDST